MILNVPDDIIENVEAGQTSGTVSWIPPTASDNSGVVTLDSTRDPSPTLDIGTYTVQYTARDPSGRTAMASFMITVQGRCLRVLQFVCIRKERWASGG